MEVRTKLNGKKLIENSKGQAITKVEYNDKGIAVKKYYYNKNNQLVGSEDRPIIENE